MQQVDGFGESEEGVCPRILFKKHLCTVIKEWTEAGEYVIVCMDANENLQRTDTASIRHGLIRSGIREMILSGHGQVPPNTFPEVGSK